MSSLEFSGDGAMRCMHGVSMQPSIIKLAGADERGQLSILVGSGMGDWFSFRGEAGLDGKQRASFIPSERL